MQTAKQRENEFKQELTALLAKYDAEIYQEIHGDAWAEVRVSLHAKYEDLVEVVPYADFSV